MWYALDAVFFQEECLVKEAADEIQNHAEKKHLAPHPKPISFLKSIWAIKRIFKGQI
jgi:hypothetical protein